MNAEMYEKLKKTQDTYWWYTAKQKIVLDIFETYCLHGKSEKILDVGCGMGLMLEKLSKYGEVFGMDSSTQAVDYCREIWDEKHIVRGTLPEGIPFEREYFDAIIALDVIEHIEEDKQSLKKLYALLKPEGILILTVPAFKCLWSWNDVALHHKRRYQKKQLQNICEDAGLQIRICSYYNFWLFGPIYVVRTLKNLLKIQKEDGPDEVKDTLVNRLLYRVFSSERHRLCKGKGFPFGVSLILVGQK